MENCLGGHPRIGSLLAAREAGRARQRLRARARLADSLSAVVPALAGSAVRCAAPGAAGRLGVPHVPALFLAGAAPDTVLLPRIQREAQALRPYRTMPADRLGRRDLLVARAQRGQREEQFGIFS